ncbi:MAG TPA: radical SAM protein [Terriglobia bacterium]|nr:radical SAM protein [Terriglobia bacterium]
MATALISISPAGLGPPSARPSAGLVGIARMAAESPQVRARADTEYFAMQSRSTLNRESSGRMPFAWTLNPYRGCEFGCKYCYARYSHEFMEMWDGLDFERKIFAKINAPELLREELRRARDKGLPIALGTATDPYQPAEKQFGITRKLLEVFAQFEGLEFSITTKGTLILRDLDLLRTIAARHKFSVHITVTTMDERLARLLEPKAPPPVKRLEAISELARAGMHVGVNAMPILPGLTDSERSLDQLASSAAQAGARYMPASILFLMPSAMKQFMPFLEREFPQLVKRYRKLYARSAYLDGEYKEQIKKLMAELRVRYGLLGGRAGDQDKLHRLSARRQMALSFLASGDVVDHKTAP